MPITENKRKLGNIISFTEFNLTDINITHYQINIEEILNKVNI